MRAHVVTPPAPFITYEQAVLRLRLAGGDREKLDVEAMIAAATGELDGPQGWLGRALGRQTIEVDFDGFDDFARELPWPDAFSIEEVSYLGSASARQTLAPAAYELLGNRLVPIVGSYWPCAYGCGRDRPGVRVRYVTGYAAVPETIRSAILVMVGSAYRNRDQPADALPQVEAMLAPFRVYR
ncbi:head-tail connector protein [Sphingomonas sp.]|uniref:head-tail connector protein n=1 Tax=Sphingomonas sp. TaxID=28214 RepID=UPI003B00D715